MRLFAGCKAYEQLVPSGVTPLVRLLTITPPGVAGGLVWDEDVCRHFGPHKHNGLLGCRVKAAAAARFNELAPTWWRRLNEAARQQTVRSVGTGPLLIARVWQLQERGALHVHLVVGYSTLSEKRSADRFVAELARLSPRHGFGWPDRKREVREASAAAAYLSGYFCKGKGTKLTLTESVRSGQMPPSIFYVRSQLLQRSGITMRSLRLKRYLWHRWGPDALKLVLRETGLSITDFYRATVANVDLVQLIRAADWSQAP